MSLEFGKYKGSSLEDVPHNYLWFLTCWELDNTTRVSVWNTLHPEKDTFKNKIVTLSNMKLDSTYDKARIWVAKNHDKVIWAARELWKAKHLCCHCQKKLRDFRVRRDWQSRYLHKKCYLEIF